MCNFFIEFNVNMSRILKSKKYNDNDNDDFESSVYDSQRFSDNEETPQMPPNYTLNKCKVSVHGDYIDCNYQSGAITFDFDNLFALLVIFIKMYKHTFHKELDQNSKLTSERKKSIVKDIMKGMYAANESLEGMLKYSEDFFYMIEQFSIFMENKLVKTIQALKNCDNDCDKPIQSINNIHLIYCTTIDSDDSICTEFPEMHQFLSYLTLDPKRSDSTHVQNLMKPFQEEKDNIKRLVKKFRPETQTTSSSLSIFNLNKSGGRRKSVKSKSSRRKSKSVRRRISKKK